MKDEFLLAEENGRLSEENKALKADVKRLNAQIKRFGYKSAFHFALGLGLVAGLLTGVGYPAYKGLTSSDQIRYCYTAYRDLFGDKDYSLRGSVDWQADVILGQYSSQQEAVAAAKALGCPLNFLTSSGKLSGN